MGVKIVQDWCVICFLFGRVAPLRIKRQAIAKQGKPPTA